MAHNPAQELVKFGQSVWYDNISRELLQSGELKKLIENYGVRGLTSNPTIFDKAISKSTVYDGVIKQHAASGVDAIFEQIAVEDCGAAADLFLPVYKESRGEDGYVSIEVSPLLATDTKGTIEEGRRLFKRLNRPNIMIKVPGTAEGLPAVQTLLEDGINVNITLLFSVENYEDVARTYISALRNRLRKGLPVADVRSVASFFVSRVDTIIDARLSEIIANAKVPATAEKAQSLLGRFGVANSRLAYEKFQQIFSGNEFAELKNNGALVQRPLWASTSMKNPKYRDVLYVEELIGPNTVNTMPHETLIAFADHGNVAQTVTTDLAGAKSLLADLTAVGVNVPALLKQLQEEGVAKFSDSFHALRKSIQGKL